MIKPKGVVPIGTIVSRFSAHGSPFIIQHILVILFFCIPLSLWGSTSTPSPMEKALQDLVNQLPVGSVYSIQVRDPVSAKVLFEKGGQFNLVPASVLKVMTATLAYDALGDEFRYRTRILSQHQPSGRGGLKGPVVLVFSGDPSFTRGDLDKMVGQLADNGVSYIKGDIWLDGNVFIGHDRAGGVSWDDLNICYAAPASAMILDRNCFYAWLKPGKKDGDKAVITYDQPDWFLMVENRVTTLSDENCRLVVRSSLNSEYSLNGCVDLKAKPLRLAFSINNVERAVSRYLRTLLRRKDIQLTGRVRIGRPPEPTPLVMAEHESEDLPRLLKPVLSRSDNLYSDSLIKTVGTTLSGKPGSFSQGLEMARNLLGSRGVEFGSSRLVDGSGLSRYNFISASTLADVLSYGWNRWGENTPWLDDRKQKNIWYKTGTMSGVSSMVGYVFQPNGKPLVFAVILNGLMPPFPATYEEQRTFRKEIRRFHANFLKVLSDQYNDSGVLKPAVESAASDYHDNGKSAATKLNDLP